MLDTVGRFNLPFPPPTLERGYPEPVVLLKPPAQNPGCAPELDPPGPPWNLLDHPEHPGPFLDPLTTLTASYKAARSEVLDILQYTEEGTCRFPQSLFLTGERSDAAVVGSGNKAMGKSSLLTF